VSPFIVRDTVLAAGADVGAADELGVGAADELADGAADGALDCPVPDPVVPTDSELVRAGWAALE
jgi:hypothetical protein